MYRCPTKINSHRDPNAGNSVHAVELVFLLLLLFVVVFAALARKIQVPYPIVLVVAGLILSFIPGIPHIYAEPRRHLLDRASAFALRRRVVHRVGATSPTTSSAFFFWPLASSASPVWGVAEAAHYSFASFDLRLGVVLGAVVATTDAIAATAIAKHLGLPQRIVDILEGESLVNDATGLLALEFGVAMVVRGEHSHRHRGHSSPRPGSSAPALAIGLLIALFIRAHRALSRRRPHRNHR